jgi:hypothetical protein
MLQFKYVGRIKYSSHRFYNALNKGTANGTKLSSKFPLRVYHMPLSQISRSRIFITLEPDA